MLLSFSFLDTGQQYRQEQTELPEAPRLEAPKHVGVKYYANTLVFSMHFVSLLFII
jgi:hypothetical protein